MNLGRRVVLSVALAAALAVVAGAVERIVVGRPDGGWFMYDPNGEVPFSANGTNGDTLTTAAIWLVAIAIWLVVAWRLFRPGADEPAR